MPSNSNVEKLFHPAIDFPKGNDVVWKNRQFEWKEANSWVPCLTAWLEPHFRKDGMRRLKPGKFRDLYGDDSEWLEILAKCLKHDIDYHVERLSGALYRATLKTYHGCRTEDVGSYFRHGLRVHNRDELTDHLKSLISKHDELRHVKPTLDEEIAKVEKSFDEGRLFVVIDDTVLLDRAAHYLIYGSEWISAVLGHNNRKVLLKSGIPTLLEIDLPLKRANSAQLRRLAERMLTEWTMRACNYPDWHTPVDFSFILQFDLPPTWIVGHTHPKELKDPLEYGHVYRTPRATCAYCDE